MAYYCKKYLRRLTQKDIDVHGCFSVRKGHRKGRKCSLL
ncbi:unnamed protein product, partial [marine sediment metagenome]